MITIPSHEGTAHGHGPHHLVAGAGDRPVLFVSDFRYVERPYATLEPLLLDPTPAWLAVLSAPSARRPQNDPAGAGDALPSAIVRIGLGRRRPSMPVLVSLGPSRVRPGEVVIPLGWKPLQLEQLLPSLDGDLSLTDVEGTACRLGLTGRYQAPLAAIGEQLDRFALHGVAESSVRNFLEEIESALLAVAGDGDGDGDGDG